MIDIIRSIRGLPSWLGRGARPTCPRNLSKSTEFVYVFVLIFVELRFFCPVRLESLCVLYNPHSCVAEIAYFCRFSACIFSLLYSSACCWRYSRYSYQLASLTSLHQHFWGADVLKLRSVVHKKRGDCGIRSSRYVRRLSGEMSH